MNVVTYSDMSLAVSLPICYIINAAHKPQHMITNSIDTDTHRQTDRQTDRHTHTHTHTHNPPYTTTLTDRPLLVEVTCVVDVAPSDAEAVSPASEPVTDDVEVVLSLLGLTGPHKSSGVMSSDTSSPDAFLADRNSSIGLMASDWRIKTFIHACLATAYVNQ